MPGKILWCAQLLILFTPEIAGLPVQTLQQTLQAANVPVSDFPASELSQKISSYAISQGNPFLLAYYVDDGSERLVPPLHVIRYDRATGALRRADLREITALFQGTIPMDCLGSALDIREQRGTIYIGTHYNPSAGCVIVLSSELVFRRALSGWLLGLMGSQYAILQESEIHFMSVHPMHIAVYDVRRDQSIEVYPYRGDPQRRQFADSIRPTISRKWCMDYAAQCDPENFDTTLLGYVIVNESARVFGFRAQFDAAGFGPAAERQVRPRTIAYVFRERGGRWEHREFREQPIQRLLGGMKFDELIRSEPELVFRQ